MNPDPDYKLEDGRQKMEVNLIVNRQRFYLTNKKQLKNK